VRAVVRFVVIIFIVENSCFIQMLDLVKNFNNTQGIEETKYAHHCINMGNVQKFKISIYLHPKLEIVLATFNEITI
jgi:hypothetical protein